MKVLVDHDKPYESFVRTREAHGVYDTGNPVEYMNEAVAFLEEHLQK